MAESLKEKRIKFSKGKQQKFLLHAKKELDFTWQEFSNFLGISLRHLIDWKNEKFSLTYQATNKTCKKLKIPLPSGIKIQDQYWYVAKGAKKGGLARYKKYGTIGDPEKRKIAWKKWWKEQGQYIKRPIYQPLPFHRPAFSSTLAEFIGIMLGDGGMTRNQISITLHCRDDKDYSNFVIKLVKELFKIKATRCKHKIYPVFTIRISRTLLAKFCHEELGLPIGNKVKQQANIPSWIIDNQDYQIACLRGLVDTDGSIMFHRYTSGGKLYCYKKISYCSRSFPLLQSASQILNNLKIKHRITKNKYEIRIEAQEAVNKYFTLIGSHNEKHLKKYKKGV